jgi:hypothetical protein
MFTRPPLCYNSDMTQNDPIPASSDEHAFAKETTPAATAPSEEAHSTSDATSPPKKIFYDDREVYGI